MHPEIMMELARQHRADLLAEARRFAAAPKPRRKRNRLWRRVSAWKRQFAT